jgi:hypothetical protein
MLPEAAVVTDADGGADVDALGVDDAPNEPDVVAVGDVEGAAALTEGVLLADGASTRAHTNCTASHTKPISHVSQASPAYPAAAKQLHTPEEVTHTPRVEPPHMAVVNDGTGQLYIICGQSTTQHDVAEAAPTMHSSPVSQTLLPQTPAKRPHQIKHYGWSFYQFLSGQSVCVREKDWSCRKRGTQAT